MILALGSAALAFTAGPAVRAPTTSASSASMLFGLRSKNAESVSTMSGKVAPTNQGAYSPELLSAIGLKLEDLGRELKSASVAAPASESGLAPVTLEDVEACQAGWANAIATISSTYKAGGDFVGAAGDAAGELYGYGHDNVLFKPTKATKNPFRPTGDVAMSYFVGSEAMNDDRFTGEDAGFAINGGKGWSDVVFTNHQVDLHSEVAIAMGSYDFTCATTGDVVTVEYTFGYKACADGKPRICLHHSSVPYSAAPAGPSMMAVKVISAGVTKTVTVSDDATTDDLYAAAADAHGASADSIKLVVRGKNLLAGFPLKGTGLENESLLLMPTRA